MRPFTYILCMFLFQDSVFAIVDKKLVFAEISPFCICVPIRTTKSRARKGDGHGNESSLLTRGEKWTSFWRAIPPRKLWYEACLATIFQDLPKVRHLREGCAEFCSECTAFWYQNVYHNSASSIVPCNSANSTWNSCLTVLKLELVVNGLNVYPKRKAFFPSLL